MKSASTHQPRAYRPPELEDEIRIPLSRNESWPTISTSDLVDVPTESIGRYPSMTKLQDVLGDWLQLDPTRIVISAGGDDALERVIRLAIQTGRTRIATHTPSFEMIDVYASHHRGEVTAVEWSSGDFPFDPFLAQLDERTGLAILVTPNNPTGATIPASQILQLADATAEREIPLLVDHAYIEFASEDSSGELWDHPNVLVLRTLSKAWGLAGLRTGFLIAPTPEKAALYRSASGPFPVSGLSLELACHAVQQTRDQMAAQVARICQFRDQLRELLLAGGLDVAPSEGNFLLVRTPDAKALWRELGEAGIATRLFPDNPRLADALRITLPPHPADFLHLAKTLKRILSAEFDLGQLALDTEIQPRPSAPIPADPGDRTAKVERKTRETSIDLALNLDGSGQTEIDTGIGFFDHMLTALAFHSRFDLKLRCAGDLEVDDHHTVEDCALALGEAIDRALGKRTGIVRFGFAYAPLDEALARTVIDLSGRPWPAIDLQLKREQIGELATENLTHFFISLAMSLKCSLHVDVLRGDNDHHRAEAAFKSLALALRTAVSRTAGAVPSTKGVL